MPVKRSITFIDKNGNRYVTFDNPLRIEFLDDGILKIKCEDGFQTLIAKDEWQKAEIKKRGINAR